jgi:hypothetical protein
MNTTTSYRAAAAIAVISALIPLWMFGALAAESDSPGPIFFVPLAVGIIGAVIARFRPSGMSRALFATAAIQALVAVVEMIAWKQYMELSLLNGIFTTLWVTSALLFRKASRVNPAPVAI